MQCLAQRIASVLLWELRYSMEIVKYKTQQEALKKSGHSEHHVGGLELAS